MNGIKDGNYIVDARLSGGSGRARIESPASVTVENGEAKVKIEWDSPYYDYMEVEGRGYYPVNEGGNSAFVIDAEFDREIPVKAETLAMSSPHMIDYSLYFDSSSLRKDGFGAPYIAIAAALLAGAVFASILTRKRKRHEK